jgi:hypothetical protein
LEGSPSRLPYDVPFELNARRKIAALDGSRVFVASASTPVIRGFTIAPRRFVTAAGHCAAARDGASV